MRFRALGGIVAAALMLATLPASVSALDQRFTDADGDLVADTPKDAKQVIDPPVLIFSYTPVEDPAMYAKVWDSFIKHLEKTTGKRVQFFPVQSNAAQLEAMRAGRLHVAGFNSGSVPLAVNCAGFVPFTLMAAKDGQYGYEMEIITFPGSGVTKMSDIKGRKMAFTAQTSNSGYRAPSALLKKEYGLEAGKDYEPVFSGKHDNSVIGVANKDYPAAAIANEVMFRIIERGVVKKDQIITIYKSKTYPTTGYGMVYNLKPELAAKVKEAFFTFNWDGSELAKEFASTTPPMQKFLPINYKEHWQSVRESDEAVGVKYDCKG